MQKRSGRRCVSSRPIPSIPSADGGASPSSLGSLGACRDREQTRFSVLAPAARSVSLCGDFNGWRPHATPMMREENGVWRVSLPSSSLPRGALYKFAVEQTDGELVYRTDPYATCVEPSPRNGGCAFG